MLFTRNARISRQRVGWLFGSVTKAYRGSEFCTERRVKYHRSPCLMLPGFDAPSSACNHVILIFRPIRADSELCSMQLCTWLHSRKLRSKEVERATPDSQRCHASGRLRQPRARVWSRPRCLSVPNNTSGCPATKSPRHTVVRISCPSSLIWTIPYFLYPCNDKRDSMSSQPLLPGQINARGTVRRHWLPTLLIPALLVVGIIWVAVKGENRPKDDLRLAEYYLRS